ncbi:unnamed protein product [Mytilus coruscus]|uniref:Novel STAND NTPase 3 domain-containing protein n=1 Tax=Mytilus coruscus TaxID=42192 RepID=A0A6J8BA34_MYTCO|nr:unnamed protein product [Mytilus coruscus]
MFVGYNIQIVGSLEGVQCASDRYQPFIFWTNGSHLCQFEKSICEGEGQIRYSLGTTKADGTCKCDYTKGYDFVVGPKNACFCMPTEEDCSCFIRQCPSGFVLSPGKYTSEQEIWKDTLIKFVSTHASQEILFAIAKSPCVLITGPFGSGKTTIVHHIISKFRKEGFEATFASDPKEIVRRSNHVQNQRQLFVIDDVFGKYSSNISDITDRWEQFGSTLRSILLESSTVKVIITSRTYIYLLNAKCFENLRNHVSFIHKDLNSEKLRLNLEERRNIYKSYFRCDPPKSISDDILLLYHFYPAMCSSYNKENILEYFKHPDEIISAEISDMQRRSDIAFLALAVLVILNNRVENKILSGMNKSEKLDNILRAICVESSFNQYPSQHMLFMTLMSLEGEFIKSDGIYCSFYCTELFDLVAACLGGSFFQSILKYSSSVFIKEKLQLTPKNSCSHTIRVPENMENQFYQRLISDMKNNFIFDVLSNKLFESMEYRETFLGYLRKHVKSAKLVDASTDSNVLHIVSSLGYSDFMRYFLDIDKYPNVNKTDYRRKTPLHLACQQGHKRCVECLIKYKAAVNETDFNKRTALHYACEAGNEEIVKYLITNNASINNKDLKGMTPLHIACEKMHCNVGKCLVENKVYINEADKSGRTPLHYACKHGIRDIVEILILNNAHVNKADDQGYTPLHISCEYGNAEVVKLLVKNKAITNSKTKQGLTPLDIASKNRLETISNVLRQCKTNT